MKNIPDVINKRLYITKEEIGNFEDIAAEIIQNKQREKKYILNEQIISELWKHFKHPNKHVISVSKREGVDRKYI